MLREKREIESEGGRERERTRQPFRLSHANWPTNEVASANLSRQPKSKASVEDSGCTGNVCYRHKVFSPRQATLIRPFEKKKKSSSDCQVSRGSLSAAATLSAAVQRARRGAVAAAEASLLPASILFKFQHAANIQS